MIAPIMMVPLFALGIVLIARIAGRDDEERSWLLRTLLSGYALRLFLHIVVIPNFSFFSHGVPRGDSAYYEAISKLVAHDWDLSGFHFVTEEEIPELHQVALIANAFGLVTLINGGETSSVACTALVAFFGMALVADCYKAAVEFGAETRDARFTALALLWSPSFIFHTSDCYKDGLVGFLVMTIVLGGMRVAKRFSMGRLVGIGLAALALWYVRFYMVFMSALPAAVGFIGLRAKTPLRPVLSLLAATAAILPVLWYTSAFDTIVERAQGTFNHATDPSVRQWNADIGGSGVVFDDRGDPFGAFGSKLAYTLLSPFPWQGGSIALQLGKLEALLFYVLQFRALRTARSLWYTQPGVLIMFLAFLVPGTLAYATTVSNIGLIVRQRFPLMAAIAVLGALVPASVAKAQQRARNEARRRSHQRGLPTRGGPPRGGPPRGLPPGGLPPRGGPSAVGGVSGAGLSRASGTGPVAPEAAGPSVAVPGTARTSLT